MASQGLDGMYPKADAETRQLEESTIVKLQQILEEYRSSYAPSTSPTDVLHHQYRINVDKPLPHLETKFTRAYEATSKAHPDVRYYALVLDHQYAHRATATEALLRFNHPNGIRSLDYGRTKISIDNDYRRVFVFEQPPKTRLRELLSKGQRFHERQIVYQVLTPIIEYLTAMKEKGVSHGRINPGNIFLGRNVVLGECMGERSGYSQIDCYEPVERMLADPCARGEPTEKTDVYALGMVMYAMLFGTEKIEKIPKKLLADQILVKGSYALYLGSREMTNTLEDFFRGTLVDDPRDRWGLEQLASWLDGKRFNLIYPNPPRDTSRPFLYNEQEYFNLKAVANAMHEKWTSAIRELSNTRMDRWIESGPDVKHLAAPIAQIINNAEDTDRARHDMVTRVLATLDNFGPMRAKEMAVHIDGIGTGMLEYFREGDMKKVDALIDMIWNNLPQYILDLNPLRMNTHTQAMLWNIPNIRKYLTIDNYGFGVERIIYELNRSLPCQSPIIVEYSIDDLKDALRTLDMISKEKAMNTSFDDRELAAFLASRLGIVKEQRVKKLSFSTGQIAPEELVVINIIAMAQNSFKKLSLIGLSTWVAIRISEYMNNIHNRTTRRRMRKQLLLAAQTGKVQNVLNVVFDPEVIDRDEKLFKRAGDVYERTDMTIAHLKRKETANRMARRSGDRLSVSMGYVVMLITTMLLLYQYWV